MSLHSTQQAFMNYLQTGYLDHDIIKGCDQEQKQALAEVYHYAYRARFVEVLQEQFPKLASYLGDQEFLALVENYIACYPSTYRNIRCLGRMLPNFVAENFDHQDAQVLAELARFEWALVDMFDAADSPYFTMGQLQAVDSQSWPERKIIWQQAMQMQSFAFDVVSLWRNDQDLVVLDASVLFWRCQRQVYFDCLTASEKLFIDVTNEGATLGELCECLLELHDESDIPEVLLAHLQLFIERRCIADLIC